MTECKYCGKRLLATKQKTVYAYNGSLYCNLTCACEQVKDTVRAEGEYVDKSILKGENNGV